MAGYLSLFTRSFLWTEARANFWRMKDILLISIFFVWLIALPISLLISFRYARQKQRYLHVCTMLLSLAAAAQFAFVLYDLLPLPFSLQGASLISLFSLIGWLAALYLISVVWSKIRFAKRPVS